MKKLLLLISLLATQPSHSGFVSGVVVGSALSSDNKPVTSTQTIRPTALGYDVIVCCTSRSLDFTRCSTRGNRDLTPLQFAKESGFRSIRVQFFIPRTDSQCDMIGMEVSR